MRCGKFMKIMALRAVCNTHGRASHANPELNAGVQGLTESTHRFSFLLISYIFLFIYLVLFYLH